MTAVPQINRIQKVDESFVTVVVTELKDDVEAPAEIYGASKDPQAALAAASSSSSSRFTLIEEKFLCDICLDVFSDPVTLPRGHNFCQHCVAHKWDSSARCQRPSCKCPFYKRPDLRVNSFISEIAARFRDSAGSSSSDRWLPNRETFALTSAEGRSVKSCLASYSRSI
ncbi:Tripartite motif-containing protein 65 [Liparis tanakae]|uniref:Tripartite motif-containing protein 65 n=1 Tax=Liparis tanakae TaxID=230148 RepID=A0A4Z2F4R6_9TELE|nr:Tripartite motif-containing protein 65 [Liparis tanakae]